MMMINLKLVAACVIVIVLKLAPQLCFAFQISGRLLT